MMDWQVTATAIVCDRIKNFVVIMVYPNETASCSYVIRCDRAKKAKSRLEECGWPDCTFVRDFQKQAYLI